MKELQLECDSSHVKTKPATAGAGKMIWPWGAKHNNKRENTIYKKKTATEQKGKQYITLKKIREKVSFFFHWQIFNFQFFCLSAAYLKLQLSSQCWQVLGWFLSLMLDWHMIFDMTEIIFTWYLATKMVSTPVTDGLALNSNVKGWKMEQRFCFLGFLRTWSQTPPMPTVQEK